MHVPNITPVNRGRGVAASGCSHKVSSVPDVGVGLPEASWGGGEVVGGAAPAARRVQSQERIKGRTKLWSPHVLLRLPRGVLSIQFSASAGQCRRWSDESSAAPVPGNWTSFGAQTTCEVCCLGWGPATAGCHCFVDREGRDGPLRSPGGKTPPAPSSS